MAGGRPSGSARNEFIDLEVPADSFGRRWHVCRHCDAYFAANPVITYSDVSETRPLSTSCPRDQDLLPPATTAIGPGGDASETTSECTAPITTIDQPSVVAGKRKYPPKQAAPVTTGAIPIVGRSGNYKSHLDNCDHYKTYLTSLQVVAAQSNAANVHQPNQECNSLQQDLRTSSLPIRPKRQRRLEDFFGEVPQVEAMKFFETALLQFLADNGLPFSFVERLSTERAFQAARRLPVLEFPSRKKLGGEILKRQATECQQRYESVLRDCQATTGGRVNFMSDAWQNIARTNLLGCHLSLFGNTVTYGLFPTGSHHDGLTIAVHMENSMLNMQDDGWMLGAILTDGAGQCAKARRTLSLRWPMNPFVTCFAHAANNLAKAVLKSEYATVTKQASRAVTVLNNSATKWLEEAKTCMVQKYGYSLNLKQLCETRWNSMQGCFASLLRVRGSLQNFTYTFRDANLPDELRVFESPSFWKTLVEAEEVIRPLSYASLKLQRDENTLADVVICYLDIFTSFSTCKHGRENLTKLVEKYWYACEQPLLLLALFLHPLAVETRQKLVDKTPMTKRTSMCRIAAYYYRRLIGGEATNLFTDMMAWLDGKLDTPDFSSVGTIPGFWSFVQADMGNSKLPQLAIVVLAIAANTATCERYFSELALIHTSRRNRLGVDKVKDVAVVRKHVRDIEHAERVTNSSATSTMKRLIRPEERPSARDNRFDQRNNEAEDDSGDDDDASGAAFEYWLDVLGSLDGDSDTDELGVQNCNESGDFAESSRESEANGINCQDEIDGPPGCANDGNYINGSESELNRREVDERNRRKQFDDMVAKIARLAKEEIPRPNTQPFPDNPHLVTNFPQEKIVPNDLRGLKVTLADLSKSVDELTEQVNWHFMSPQPRRSRS